jgi:hypothetical protein
VVLGTALVLLFPSISITDDLHAEEAVMEESSRVTLKTWQATQSCIQAGKHSVPLVGIAARQFSDLSLWVLGNVVRLEIELPKAPLVSPSRGRAPPAC